MAVLGGQPPVQCIQELADAVNGGLTRLVDDVLGLLDASQGYTTFSGLSEDMTGTVRFIIRTDPAE